MRGLSSEECLSYKGHFDTKCSDMCADTMKVRPELLCVLLGDKKRNNEKWSNCIFYGNLY